MANTQIKTRIIHKHDTEQNWNKATNFIPKQGEIIIYDKDSTYAYERIKVGDGTTLVTNLPFIDNNVKVSFTNQIDNLNSLKLDKKDYYGFSKTEGKLTIANSCIENKEIRVKQTFSPKREGSGSPYPAGCGKNIIDIYSMIPTSSNTLIERTNNTMRVYNTTAGTYNRANITNMVLKAGVTYTLSAEVTAMPGGFARVGFVNQSTSTTITNGSVIFSEAGKGATTFSVTEDTTVYFAAWCSWSTSIAGDATFKNIQVEISNTATDYMPYENIRPISGWTRVELTRAGKNLLPKVVARSETKNGVTFTSNGDGSYTIKGTSTGSAPFSFTAEAQAAIPAGAWFHLCNEGTITNNVAFVPKFTDNTNYSLAFTVKNRTYQIGENHTGRIIKEVGIYVNGVVEGIDITFRPMMCMDGTPGEFEPYQGINLTTDFDQTVYGGRLDWQTGQLSVEKAMVVLDGTHFVYRDPGWVKGVYNIQGAAPDAVEIPGYTTLANLECSHVPTTTPALVANGNRAIGIGQGSTSFYLNFGLQHETKEAFNAYLAAQKSAGTPVQVVYKLAVPYTIQLTKQEITTLQNTNIVYGNGDNLLVEFGQERSDYIIPTTREGNPIVFEDGIEKTNIQAVTDFKVNQSGNGDPYPAGGRKNLIGNFRQHTLNGITFTVNVDGSVRAHGTSTAQTSTESAKVTLKPGTYTLSGCPAGGTNANTAGGYALYTLIGGTQYIWDTGSGVTFTLDNETTLTFVIIIRGGTTIDKIFYPMLEAGSTRSDYQPYSNIRPITGYDSVRLTRYGRNALPNTAKTQTINGVTFTPKADGSVIVNGTAAADIFYQLSDDALIVPGAYTLKGSPTGGGTGAFAIRAMVNNANFYDDFGDGRPFSIGPNSVVKGYIVVRTGYSASNLRFYPGLYSQNDTQTEYEPYQGINLSADFGRTICSGTLDWQTGILTIDKAILSFTGDETFVNYGTGLPMYYPTEKPVNDGAVVSSHLIQAKDYTQLFNTPNCVRAAQDGIVIHWKDIVNTNDFLTAIKTELKAQYNAGTPVQVAYTLANPITIQLTPQEIKEIAGINTLYSDGSNIRAVFNVINSITLDSIGGLLPIEKGGTGAKTPTEARAALGITPENIRAATQDQVDRLSSLVGSTSVSAQISNYAPSKTGTGASGKWEISITGSSSATDKMSIWSEDAKNANQPGLYVIGAAGVAVGNTADYSVDTPQGYSNTVQYGTILRLKYNNNNVYYTDIYTDTNNKALLYKTVNNGISQGWVRILDSNNFGNYALPITGGNVTGILGVQGTGDYEFFNFLNKEGTLSSTIYSTEKASGTDKRLTFRVNSYNSSTNKPLETYENYVLPPVTENRAYNVAYDILTSKNAVTVAQGGTGATNITTARNNLDVPSKEGVGAKGDWNINAATATKATQDGDGAVISSTYLKKNGGSMSGRLTLATSITDHADPMAQILCINCTSVPSGTTISDKNAPGIGFHIANNSWGSLILNSGNFKFINNNATGYMPVYASTFYGNLSGKINITETNPSSGTSYMIPFMTSTGSQSLLGNDGIGYWTREGTTSADGTGELKLGNNISSGTAGNKQGMIYMYGTSSGYTELIPSNNTSTNIKINLPSSAGTLALTSSDITGNASTATSAQRLYSNTNKDATGLIVNIGTLPKGDSGSGIFQTPHGTYTANGVASDYGSILRVRYGANYYHDLWFDANNPQGIYYKQVVGNSSQGWKRILDSSNFHHYALSLASGGTLNGVLNIKSSGQYPRIDFTPKFSTNTPGTLYYNAGGENSYASTVQFFFRQYSPASAGTTSVVNYYEDFRIPATSAARTSNGYYTLLSTRDAVTVPQGGTGATTASGARTNLGICGAITHGAGDPTGGAVGDIYFKHN